MIPCSGFIEVQSVDADAGLIPLACHPPPFRMVTKNGLGGNPPKIKQISQLK